MSFKESNVTVRMGVRDAAYRLGKLAELLTLGHGPITDDISTDMDALANKMMANLELAGYKDKAPAGETRIKNGDTVTTLSSDASTLSVPATATVTGNTLEHVKLNNATDAIVQDAQDISIQDRNSITLLGSGVRARVARGGLISAYFSGLNYGISSDGNPLDVTPTRGSSTTKGRVRMLVSANQLKNVYLDGAAITVNGEKLSVYNSSAQLISNAATATVSSANLLTSIALPSDITAFRDGVSHQVNDSAGNYGMAAAVVQDGKFVGQGLVGQVNLVFGNTTKAIKDNLGNVVNDASTYWENENNLKGWTLPDNNALLNAASLAQVSIRDNQSRTSKGMFPTFVDGKLTELVMPDYTALVKNNMYPTFALTYDGKSPEGGDAALTAQVSQSGGLSMLLPKSAIVIANGGTVTGMDGKTYKFVISNGKVVSVTVGTAS